MSFFLTVPNCTSDLGKGFSLQSLEFYSCIQCEIRKIGLLILLNCEAVKPGFHIVVRIAEHACDDASKRILKFSTN